jgi:hypothetical protein
MMRRSLTALVFLLAVAAIVGHLEPARGQTQSGPASVEVDKDVVYITGGKVMMDVARPTTPGPHPAVVTLAATRFARWPARPTTA